MKKLMPHRKKILVTMASFLFLFILSSTSFAVEVYESGERIVSSLFVQNGNLRVRFNPAPAGCEGGEQYGMHAYLEPTDPNYKEMYAALLTAYTSGDVINGLWYDDQGTCSSSYALKFTAIRFKYK